MTLANVQGQERAVDRLAQALRKGTVHHAYLFAGPEGVGKELAARGFAQALLCGDKPGEGCGACSVCSRLERNSHPDVLWVMPEATQVARGLAARADFDHVPSRALRIEQVRALQERLSLRAFEGRYKLVVLLEAEAMNEPAQNALLKTLEEPPADTVLVLVTSATDALKPTLRSRVSYVPFGPLPKALIASRVRTERGLDEPTAALVAELSGGSLGKALAIDVEALAGRRALIQAFEALTPDDARGWLGFAEEHGSREDAEEALSLLAVWIRDVLLARAGRPIAQEDLLPLAQKAAAKVSEVELLRRAKLIEEARYWIAERNGSPRLQLERMLIEMEARA